MTKPKLAVIGLLVAVAICGGIALASKLDDQSAVQTKTTIVKNAAADAALDSIVKGFGTKYGTKVGIVVYDTSTGHEATTNQDESFVSASLYKLYVAYGILRKVDDGNLSLSANIDNQPIADPPGTGDSIQECLTKMIEVSDNACGKALGEVAGWANLDTLLKSEGYTGTMLNNYDSTGVLSGDKHTTASDIALLLENLYNGKLLSSSSNALFLQLLASQEIDSYLPSGFPAGTKIAHKTGTLYGYVHDAGIVYGTNKNLIVVFMSGEWADPNPDSIPVFKAFGQALETYLTTNY